MTPATRHRIQAVFGLAGLGAIVVALSLPLAVVDPAHEGPVIDLGFPGRGGGFTGVDAVVLSPGVAAVALSLWKPGSRATALATFTLGLYYLAYPFYYAKTVLQDPFVLADSAYLVALGGVCLVVIGAVRLLEGGGSGSRTESAGDGA